MKGPLLEGALEIVGELLAYVFDRDESGERRVWAFVAMLAILAVLLFL